MKILIGTGLILLSLSSPAQILKQLKDRALDKAKSTAKTTVTNAWTKELKAVLAEFDSTELDYALLLSDNSGLFAGRSANLSPA